MATLKDALVEAIAEAVEKVFHAHLGMGVAPKATGKAGKPKATKRAGKKKTGPVTKWAATPEAKRVPLFVQRDTKLKTKAAVLAKYGTGIFEDGRPLPPGKKAKTRRPRRLLPRLKPRRRYGLQEEAQASGTSP